MSLRHLTKAMLMAALWLAGSAQAVEANSETKIKASASASKADAAGKQTLTITIVIEKGWHIYANPVHNKLLDANATKVSILSKGKPIDARFEFPKGDLQKDKVVGDHYVYQGTVAIVAQVTRSADDGPLTLAITINACDDDMCLDPGTAKVMVP